MIFFGAMTNVSNKWYQSLGSRMSLPLVGVEQEIVEIVDLVVSTSLEICAIDRVKFDIHIKH